MMALHSTETHNITLKNLALFRLKLRNSSSTNQIDPFTVDRTGDSNGVFETMRREIFHFNIFLLLLHFARFLCINILEHEENLTGPTLESEELIICFCSF